MKIITHKQLVKRAGLWLQYNQRYSVVLTELRTNNQEIPDVIGFSSSASGRSILIECKATRSDFLTDKKKFFRQHPEQGMGNQRYFCTPKGLINPEELPPGWGLLHATEHQIRTFTASNFFETANKYAEITMLVSALRRLEISTAVFVRS